MEVSETATTIDTTTAQIENTFTSKEATDLPIDFDRQRRTEPFAVERRRGFQRRYRCGRRTFDLRAAPPQQQLHGGRRRQQQQVGHRSAARDPQRHGGQLHDLQNQFSPEFGHSSGGQFNETIKSGTNQFHGRAWEYFQNRDLNAID